MSGEFNILDIVFVGGVTKTACSQSSQWLNNSCFYSCSPGYRTCSFRVQDALQERLRGFVSHPSILGDSISRSSHDHIKGGVVSLTLNMM